MTRRSFRWLPVLLTAVLLIVVATALTATNTVPASRAGTATTAVTDNALRPVECAGLSVGGVFTGAGNFSAPNGTSWLILGSAGNDNINGGNKADCIVGGGGNDTISGGGGSDICIGGAGTDTFTSCTVSYQ